jgi:kynurenine formamidase
VNLTRFFMDRQEVLMCHEIVSQKVNRRSFLKAAAAATVAGTLGQTAVPVLANNGKGRRKGIFDLTHRLVRTFPSFFGSQVIFDEILATIPESGFYAKRWTFDEHIGTHMDAPGHFALGESLVDQIDPATLVAPIVVVDITAKAESDPNAMVDPDDLVAFERRHGRIPRGACVAMNSGWDKKVSDGDLFRGGIGYPDLNFPGFSREATEWLVVERDISGIAVDTMSLDPGNSADFAVHVSFLGSGRWGVENVANLSQIPPRGATVFVGAIPWEEGSGGPCRVLAQV